MQALLLTLGFLLTTQLGDSGGGRYAPVTPQELSDAPPITAQTPPRVEQPPIAKPLPPRSNPLRTAAPAAPQRPIQTIKSADLLRSLATPAGVEKLRGVPMTLADVVQNASSREQQTERVKSYWQLSQAVTEYYLAATEAFELQSLRNNITMPHAAWQQTLANVVERKRVTRDAVTVAQLHLQSQLGGQGTARLPLPEDLPYCGAYETRYEQIFRGRNLAEAKQLDTLLPMLRGELDQRAVDTAAAHNLLDLVDRRRGAQSDGSQLLHAYKHLALQRRVFVAAAYQYNSQIANYTQLAVPQRVGAIRLVSMLIPTDAVLPGTKVRGDIQRASADEPLSGSSTKSGQPRTFAEDGWNQTRRVPVEGTDAETSADTGTERSIVVEPAK